MCVFIAPCCRIWKTCPNVPLYGKFQRCTLWRKSKTDSNTVSIQKQYLKVLWERRREFEKFQIILEATHHGPTSLAVPSVFVEVGTTLDQWNDTLLCARVADAVMETYRREMPKVPRAICFGGTHYPEKFTKMVLQGEYALGTIVPKHSLEYIDESMFSHILKSNPDTSTVLLDSGGLGKFKTDIISMAEASNLEVVKL